MVLALVAILAAAAVGAGIVIHLKAASGTAAQATVRVPPLPTPGPASSTYTNTNFSYTISYPTAWHLEGSATDNFVRLFMVSNVNAPEAVALDVNCYPNPDQLSAQVWWQQNVVPQSGEQGVGSQTLASGASAYVAKGQGQTAYTVYTLAKGANVCQIVTYQTDPNNTQVVLRIVNSFNWR